MLCSENTKQTFKMICSPKVFCSTMQKIQYTKLKKRNHISIIPEIKEPEPTPEPQISEELLQNDDQKNTEIPSENSAFPDVSLEKQTNEADSKISVQNSNIQQIQTNPTQSSEQLNDFEQLSIPVYSSPTSNISQQSGLDNQDNILIRQSNPANPIINNQNLPQNNNINEHQNTPKLQDQNSPQTEQNKPVTIQNTENTQINTQNQKQSEIEQNKPITNQNIQENTKNQKQSEIEQNKPVTNQNTQENTKNQNQSEIEQNKPVTIENIQENTKNQNQSEIEQNKPVTNQNTEKNQEKTKKQSVANNSENTQVQMPQYQNPVMQQYQGAKFKTINVPSLSEYDDDKILSILGRNRKDTWKALLYKVNNSSSIEEIIDDFWVFINESLDYASKNQHPEIIYYFTIPVNYLCTIYPEFFDKLFEGLSQEIQGLKDSIDSNEQTYCHYYVSYLLNLLFSSPERATKYGVPYLKKILAEEQNYVATSHAIIYIFDCSPIVSAISPIAHNEIIQLIKTHAEIIKNIDPMPGRLKFFYYNLCTIMNNSRFCFAPKDNQAFNQYFYWIQ